MTSKKDLTVVWLDLANAFGSILHKLIYTALDTPIFHPVTRKSLRVTWMISNSGSP
ncbi:hypothetical protein DPMN_169913 [Dreissena polymorpha]|uniref:Reverse transcriptase n=1 Tax=Dreissena polymorpha TaxID=45954 RepID=A0A9D4ICP8_DREPO|nr:hypothetical protein DPMN_169913 [Dreissena polymorpha]